MKEKILTSSGNVFTDLGYTPEEAAILQMRADLMAKLRKFIETNRLTRANAAEMFGISQSRVSDLVRGKWRGSASKCLSLLPRGQVCTSG